MQKLKVTFCFVVLSCSLVANAQQRPYIGYAYPAGGKQGATVRVKIGGQGLEVPSGVLVSGGGITGKVAEYNRSLNNQEMSILAEQLRELKSSKKAAPDMMSSDTMMSGDMMSAAGEAKGKAKSPGANSELQSKIERRLAHYVQRPASAALAHIAYLEITIAPDAKPGRRELRLQTTRGISNPLVFNVGQLNEYTREAMITAPLQVLGKEQQALRKRPKDQEEESITLPATLNGQIASGEINRYRFSAKKGQKLVFSTQARELVPFIADAVPGWFQPVLVLKTAAGKEVAYDDDYQFRPDPVLFCEVPADGEYVLHVYDAIYRGREDFVYRITAGELPFITSVYPLGAAADSPARLKVDGWNLGEDKLPLMEEAQPGLCRVSVSRDGIVSNPRPFALGRFAEAMEKEGNDTVAKAQKVKLPVVLNGRMDRKDDLDIFQFTGKSNQVIVAEVSARRLESPMDSVLRLTDAKGRLIAFNDDFEDPFAGANTHDADSYVRAKLPADGTYYLQIADADRNFGDNYAYRLRISGPRPDFALRAVPSSTSMRPKGSTTVSVQIERKDGFDGAVKIGLKDPPAGFSANPVSISGTQMVARLTIKTSLSSTETPVDLTISGTAKVNGNEITREAVGAEDRTQAFYWRHLVPASEFKVLIFDPANDPKPARVAPELPAAAKTASVTLASSSAEKPKFTKQQVASRLRQLKFLYEEGLLTDEFYLKRVAECDAVRDS